MLLPLKAIEKLSDGRNERGKHLTLFTIPTLKTEYIIHPTF